jgi:hypothetical protein
VPTRKQKRRREKLQRHEYEYVIETETGEEIPVESPREAERAKEEDGRKASARTPAKGPVDRRGRPLQPPSWRRVLRRATIFAPLIAIFIYLTMPADRRSLAAIVFNVALLLAFFIPFSYVVDVFMYRMFLRRHERERAAKRSES